MPISTPGLKYLPDLKACVAHLMAGGLLIYPTETLYALGCIADNAQAIAKIFQFKGRPSDKPLPLIAASKSMAASVCDLEKCPPRLLDLFWPGPLTVILPHKSCFKPHMDGSKCAIRVTSGDFARQLAEQCGFPLTASSANFSGHAPFRNLADMPKDFMNAAARVDIGIAISNESKSLTMAPSTIVEPIKTGSNKWLLRICRQGVIDKNALLFHNFKVI